MFLFLTLYLSNCAGKQIQKDSDRFIPFGKKMYVGTIINDTGNITLENKIFEHIRDYYKFSSSEIAYADTLSEADIYLSIRIRKVVTEEVRVINTREDMSTRFFLGLRFSLKDIKNKTYLFEDQDLDISFLYNTTIEEYQNINAYGGYPEEVYNIWYEKIILNINHLIKYGTVIQETKYGYEDLEKDNLFDISQDTEDPLKYENYEYEYDKNDPRYREMIRQTNQEAEINKRDRLGGKGY